MTPGSPAEDGGGANAGAGTDGAPRRAPAGPYAELVAGHGLAASHRLTLAAVPDGSRVLDVGCATGYLARELAARGCTVIGVEVDPAAAAQARSVCAAIVCGDLERREARAAVREAVGEGGVDVVLCGDVLEHLRDPWDVLRWLRTQLAPGGRAVISVPNIGHWTARRQLARGRFPHDDFGLFDRTHLRFFTLASARELAARAGFEVVAEQYADAPLPLESRLPALGRLRAAALRGAPELFALQVVLVLAPA